MNVVLCFQEPESLLDLQISKWNPVIEWFSHRHDVKLIPSKNMSELPTIPKIDREKVRRQLLSYSFNAVQGFTFGVDALKSLILMSAIVEHKLSVEQAVQLARLETKFQVNIVSNVALDRKSVLKLSNGRSRTNLVNASTRQIFSILASTHIC
jgi:chaperone required for assembly of F1-ATPase